MTKTKVLYYGEIWESDAFTSKTIYENILANYHTCKVLITKNNETLNVDLKLVEFFYKEN